MRLVGSAIVLTDRDGSGQRLQQLLRDMDRRGPPAASAEQLESQRYAVTDMLADLDAARSADECLTVAATLLYAAGELLLLTHRCWSGGGKWLLREIEVLDDEQDTSYGIDLVRGVRAAANNESLPMRRIVLAVLDLAGGPLFDGFHRTTPA